MDKKIDRMMLYRRISLIFFITICAIIASVIVLIVIMNTSDYSGANWDFAELEDYGEAVTEKIELERFNTLCFFSEQIRGERTLFTDEIPNLKIVNSDKYYIEITASRGLIDKLNIENENEILTIAFKYGNYNDVTSNGKIYRGLYVDCDVFDVTVYAPVTTLVSSAEINLDFDTPKTEVLGVGISGEVREGKIYNIDANAFVGTFYGASTVELIGQVRSGVKLEARHNTKIDVQELTTPYFTTSVSCQIFGFSYIDGEDYSDYPFMDEGFLITHAIVVLFIVAVAGFVFFKYKLEKQRKEIDLCIEAIEAERKNLNNPEKTEENLLQNNE